MGRVIRIYLLDDHAILRRGVRAVIEEQPDFAVVGESGTLAEARDELLMLQPDIALVDTTLPDGSGIALCAEIRAMAPHVRVVVLTGSEDVQTVFEALEADASGCVSKRVQADWLVSGLRAVAEGKSLIDARHALELMELKRRREAGEGGLRDLTEIETRVLDLVADGLTNREIAAELFFSEKTVKNHVTSILTKLGVRRRGQAALVAAKLARSW